MERKITRRRGIELGIVAFLVAVFIILPIYAGTGTYPLAIVQGNSMYPKLQNGDLVFFTKASGPIIPNGTIIVFVQGELGDSVLDSLIRPVVVHRIIGIVVQADGTIYYRTKGDNNQLEDSSLVQSNHILGVETIVIPRVGILVLFFESPFGLVLLIALIVMFYVGKIDIHMREEKKKETFLSALAETVRTGGLPRKRFDKIEFAVKYFDNSQAKGLQDPDSTALVDWLKGEGSNQTWKTRAIKCGKCSNTAISFERDRSEVLVICPTCPTGSMIRKVIKPKLSSKKLDKLLLEAVDEALSNVGKATRIAVYAFLERDFDIKKKEIPIQLHHFLGVLDTLFGSATKPLEALMTKILDAKITGVNGVNTYRRVVSGLTLEDYVDLVKDELLETCEVKGDKEKLIGDEQARLNWSSP